MSTAIVKITRSETYRTVADALWQTNPISKQVLGICSSLAVTVQMQHGHCHGAGAHGRGGLLEPHHFDDA